MNLTNIITTGLNNPECAFFTGAFVGQGTTFRLIILLVGIQFLYKVMDKLAFEPFMTWVKQRLGYKK